MDHQVKLGNKIGFCKFGKNALFFLHLNFLDEKSRCEQGMTVKNEKLLILKWGTLILCWRENNILAPGRGIVQTPEKELY